MTASPYRGLEPGDWPRRTQELVNSHPLKTAEIVDVVAASWDAIFQSRIGPKGFRIGTDISPKPQIMGFLLHELVPLEFAARYPSIWSGERSASDKDLVYLPDPELSVEIKTSSHRSQIFGNRSYAQVGDSAKKSKSGFYLAINFQSFGISSSQPRITKIRFGWLDGEDWLGQRSQTGQQARLGPDVERGKLLTLFPVTETLYPEGDSE